MSRATLVTILLLIAIVAGVVAWVGWKAFGPAREYPPPPVLTDTKDVDPQVVELIEVCVRDVREAPSDIARRMKLAKAYHANGLLELGRAAYEQALQLDSSNPRLLHHIALLHSAQGNEQAAIEAVQRAIQLEPNYAPLHWRLGFWRLDLDELDAAQSSFQQAIQIDSSDVAAQVGLARVHLARQEYQRAADQLQLILSRASQRTPNISYVRQLLSAAERGLGRNTVGDSTTGRGIETDWPDAWHDEILALRTGYHPTLKLIEADLAAGNTQRARENVDQLLARHPNDLGGLNYLAATHFMNGRWLDGIAVLQNALQIDPSHYATHLNLTVGYMNSGQLDEALAHAQKAVEANPAYGDAHLRLGRVLLRMGKIDQAVEPLTKAVRFGANDAVARTLLGQTLLNVRQWSDAESAFALAIQLSPEHAPAHIGLAFAMAEQGDLAQAKASLQNGLRLDPNVKNAERIAARLRELEETKTQGPRMSP